MLVAARQQGADSAQDDPHGHEQRSPPPQTGLARLASLEGLRGGGGHAGLLEAVVDGRPVVQAEVPTGLSTVGAIVPG